jgi:steroid delta-isomerase-like uncharacterized protein
MTPEENKAIVRRWLEAAWNEKNLDVADEVVSDNYVAHRPGPPPPPGVAGVKQAISGWWAAFPDISLTIHHLVAEGDRVVDHTTLSGTHQGAFMGIPPTGKHFKLESININRMENGKIVEGWGEADMMGMLQQLGVIPSPDAPPAG